MDWSAFTSDDALSNTSELTIAAASSASLALRFLDFFELSWLFDLGSGDRIANVVEMC